MSTLQLFEKNSIEDLLLRGGGAVYIKKLHPSYRRNDISLYIDKIKHIDVAQYCGLWIKTYVDGCIIKKELADYAANQVNRQILFEQLGMINGRHNMFRESNCSLFDVFCAAGFSKEYLTAEKSRKSAIQSKIENTNMERYGCKNPMDNADVKQKLADTISERYGVDNVSQLQEVKDKKVMTCRNHFGVDCSLQVDEVKKKIKATVRERYGVDNVSCSGEIKRRKEATCMKHYGVPYSTLSEVVRDKMAASLSESYNESVRYPFEIKAVRDKASDTVRGRYHVNNVFQIPDIINKIADYWYQNYGVCNPYQSDEVKDKIRTTCLTKYGVHYPQQNSFIREKSLVTKRNNQTFASSSSEDELYQCLVERFGLNDVMRQYYDERYPFACDFYIKSRDMFIELNGTWTHGGHWYDGGDVSDVDKLNMWSEKHTGYYDGAVHTWSVADVKKRDTAKQHDLNYVVFWKHTLDDADLWLAMDCPDAKDWEKEYSWLPSRVLSPVFDYPDELITSMDFSKAAKAVMWKEYYKHELQAWSENRYLSYGTLQAKLYENRYKYLGKLPHELSDVEILRGLSISGLVKGYTRYDSTAMSQLLKEYNVTCVYDPCAGWGERMLCCASLGISYRGCDINEAVVKGTGELITHYGLSQQCVIHGDSSVMDMTDELHDCIFTCPPYGNREIYTEWGAENLNEADFLKWWEKVVKSSMTQNVKYFMYQIDKKHRDAMNQVLLDAGWLYVGEKIVGQNRVRHEVRALGYNCKKNYEAIQIFVRNA